ncbi:MAG TPA: C25 family cysteine peptidase, partial [Candidatus Krumholzibacteria bacterium]|nr:C25 family cysteine peptidase [Candidatus Krumholzibacteria bacterium]
LQPNIGERIDWDEAKYQGWSPPNVVEHDAPVYIRRQRVLPIGVSPVFYDASTYEVVVATQIEVEVRFATGSTRSSQTDIRDADSQWSDTFARMFVNPRQAAAWRVPKPDFASTMGAARTAPGAVKLRVRETGIHKVSASTLVAAGFPVGQSVDNLRLYRRTYNETTLTAGEVEVPIYVRESAGGIAGIFDANDLAIFYGLRLRDDTSQGDAREAYASANTYWLEPGDGLDMATRTPSPGFVSADTAAAFFQTSQHFETDTYFHERAAPHQLDAYFYTSPRVPGPIDMPFTITAVRPGGTLTLTAEIHGWNYDPVLRTVRLSLVNPKGEFLLAANHAVSNKVRTTFTAPAIPEANLSVGQNIFRMARGTSFGGTVDALLNFVTVSYPSLYRARGNALRFNTATLSGDTSVTVTGLSSTSDFELFDITSATVPAHLAIGSSHFKPVTTGFALSFRENIPAQRTFVLTPVSRMIDIPAADVILDIPSAIIGDPAESGVDALVVSHASYLPQMQTWTSYRRAQGYRVLMVDVTDVFDEFNGGVEHARAIQRFTRHFFERGNATALVLVGDASEDQKRVHDDSGPNFVPTFSFSDAVDGNLIDEMITSDKRFVKLPGPGGLIDNYPDMIVGRLPVGSTTELEIVLTKTLDYESAEASDFWRKRMRIVADDEYSSGPASLGGSQYC